VQCEIEGVMFKPLSLHSDSRGWLMELFRQDEIPADHHPVMAYVSMTRPGRVRGPHEHRRQSDCFAFVGPSTFRLYLWDNRSGSATCGRSFQAEVGEMFPALVIVPAGVVHAYKNIGSVEGIVYNAANRLYRGEGRAQPVDEIRYEDNADAPFRVED
jgi:dTDP-4-dehydrorhamnose 3,5-epimerase